MEGGEESVSKYSPSSKTQKEDWVADWLDEICPYYMAIGVPPDVFWHGDYTMLKYYTRSYQLNCQRKSEEMWLMGLYVYRAFGTVLSNAFDKQSKAKYLEEPIRMIPYTAEEKAAIAEREEQNIMNQFAAMLEQWERHSEKKPTT